MNRQQQRRRQPHPGGRVAALTFDDGAAVETDHRPTTSDPSASNANYDVPRSGWPMSARPAATDDVVQPDGPNASGPTKRSPASPRPSGGGDAARTKQRGDASASPHGSSGDTAKHDTRPARPPLADSEVLSDIQSIVGAATAPPARPSGSPPRKASSPPDRNRVFDELAASMSHARSYDLGSLQLERRFDDFDREAETARPEPSTGGRGPASRATSSFAAPDPATLAGGNRTPTSQPAEPAAATASPPAAPTACGCNGHGRTAANGATTTDFVDDLDLIVSGATDETAIPLDPGVGGRSIGASAMEAGDIILSTTDQPVSETIRDLTGSEVSHAALYVGDGRMVEAMEGGVLLRSLDTALDGDTLAVAYRHRDMTPVKAAQIVAFVTDHARKKTPFDTWGLIQVAPGQLARAICNQLEGVARQACLASASRIRVGTNDDNAFFCSELVLTALANVGLSLSGNDPSWSSPQQIVELNHNGLLDYVGHLKG